MYHEPDHLHHNEDEDADIYADALRGKKLMRLVLVAVFIFLTTLITYILL
jgi:hypothetical protein